MKKLLVILLTLCILSSLLISCGNTDGQQASDTGSDSSSKENVTEAIPEKDEILYVGYGRTNLSPRLANGMLLDVPIAGYANANARRAQKIQSDIYASCTAIKDEEGDIALIYSLDLHGMDHTDANQLRKNIQRVTGVPTQNIILNFTHNHAAPWIGSIDSSGSYRAILVNGINDAAKAAIDDLTLCTGLYAGTIDGTGYNFIRRYITDSKGNLVKHETEGDHDMPVVRFVREGKKDVILANWAAHVDTVSQNAWNVISADYIGYFRRDVEATLDAYISIHMAASGDVNPLSRISGEYDFPGTLGYGRSLAKLLTDNIGTLKKLTIKSDVSSAMGRKNIEIDHSTDHLLEKANELSELYDESNMGPFNEKCREYGIASIYEVNAIRSKASSGKNDTYELSAISIGNVAFGVAPYEMFAQNGMAIKEASEFDLTFVCAYSNGQRGYIAAEHAYENGGYEVYSCRYVKGSAEILQDEIISLIDKLYNE